MATWGELFERAFEDAKRLRDAGSYRAATNRAYYALYYSITAKVERLAPFNPHGWGNPEHGQMVGLVAQIKGLNAVEKEELRNTVRRLYRRRVQADYVPTALVGRDEAREAMIVLGTALAILKEKV